MDSSQQTFSSDLSVSDKVKMVMLSSPIPLHYLDVDELLLSTFGVKHSSYGHLKSSSKYIQLGTALYIHESLATETFHQKFENACNFILSTICEIAEFAKIPIPNKCFAAYFTTTEIIPLFTNRSIRSIVAKLSDEHPTLYKTGGSAIASKNCSYDANVVGVYSKLFACSSCVLEVHLPLPKVETQNFIPTPRPNIQTTYPSPVIVKASEKPSVPPITAPIAPARSAEHQPSSRGRIIYADQQNTLASSLSEYTDLDEAMIDAFYIEVLNSSDPEDLIPFTLYENWKTSVSSSPYADYLLTDIASTLGLTWPVIRFGEKVADFLEYDITSIKKLPAFGRKKTRTLILCVAYCAYNANKPNFTSYVRDESHREIYRSSVLASTLSFDDLLATQKLSQMITKELWEQWCQLITSSHLRYANLYELSDKLNLSWPYAKRGETVEEYVKLSLKSILNIPGIGNKKIRTLILCIAYLGLAPSSTEYSQTRDSIPDKPPVDTDSIDFPNLSDIQPPSTDSINYDVFSEIIREVISKFSSREQFIVCNRFGFNGDPVKTFEEVSTSLQVTRARVQQIQKGVVEKIVYSEFGNQLPGLISKLDIEELWKSNANQYGVLELSDLKTFEKKIDGEFLFALECCGKNVSSWLNEISDESTKAWYRSALMPYEIYVITQKIEELFLQTDTPFPLVTISRYIDTPIRDCGLAICLLPGYRIFEDYVFESRGRVSLKARRTARLHKLLCAEGSYLSLHDLTTWHNDHYPSEACSTRDADIVMREATHLFVSLGDKGWCSIGNYFVEDLPIPNPSEIVNSSDKIGTPNLNDEGSVTSILTSILKKRGYASFTEIVEDFRALTGNFFSEHSVGPVLFTKNDFAKFAPSVYGLSDQLQGFANISSDLLLNEYDCQLYAMARYAGEDFYAFPLWTPAMEQKWCEWLWSGQLKNKELRESLFYIATPDEWPINDTIIRTWKARIDEQSESYYLLREPKYSDCNLPDIRTIYALVRYAKDNGSINWISANRVLGRRIDDYHTAIDMAFLVCFGIVDPAHNWQKNHVTIEDSADVEQKLSAMLHYGQADSWNSLAGEFLINTFTITINTIDMGWVSVSEVNQLFHEAPKTVPDPVTPNDLDQFEDPDISEPEELTSIKSFNSYHTPEIIIKPVPVSVENTAKPDSYDELFLFMDDDDTITLS